MQGYRPSKWGRAESSGASWRGVGAPVRALGDPGRLLAAPVLAATQGVCGNDTARAAEIPPPDIGWKVEQLVRDNQWRSIAARLGRMVRRRGGGPAGAEVKQHTPAKGNSSTEGSHGHIIRTGKHHYGPSLPQRRHTPHGVTPYHNSLYTRGMGVGQTNGSHAHTQQDHTTIRLVTLSHNQFTP